MWDFLTFKSFVTPDLLIVIYYMGAVVMPLFSYIIYRWLMGRLSIHYDLRVDTKYKYLLYIPIIICFICMEIFWRMLFEFMIAYFDMHDALMNMSSH